MIFNIKSFKGFICMLTILAMLTSIIPFVTADEITTDVSQNSALEEKYSVSLGLLQALGIYTTNEVDAFVPGTVITRAELTKRIILAMNLSDSIEEMKSKTIFMDVSGNEFAGYINLAADLGIVNGTGNAMFEPNEPATVQMAVNMLMRALGYTFLTTDFDYAKYANQLDILDGVESEKELTASDMTLIIYNALHTEYYDISGIKGYDFVFQSGNPSIEVWHKVEYIEGIAESTEITAINQKSETDKGCIVVADSKIYNAPNKCCDLLGYKVRCYYKDDKVQKNYVYITSYQLDNEVITLFADDVTSFTAEKISYYNSSAREVSRNILSSADFIYNGKAVNLGEHSFEKIKSGFTVLKLIDNNGDRNIDVVFITKSESWVVASIDTTRERIFGKEQEYINLYGTGDTIYAIKASDGTVISLDTIKEWNVVTISQSIENDYICVLVSTATLTGIAEAVNGTEGYAVIDGIEYKIKKELIADKKVSIGQNGTFYIDADGVICGVDYVQVSGKKMVYATKVANVSKLGVDCEFGCVEGENVLFNKYKFASRVKIDGVSVKEEDITKTLTEDKFPEVMAIALNADGEISEVDTVTRNLAYEHKDSLAKRYDGKVSGRLFYSSWGNNFNGQLVLSDTALNYALPENETDYNNMFTPQYTQERTYDVDLYSWGTDTAVCQMSVVRGLNDDAALIDREIPCCPFVKVLGEYIDEEAVDVLYYVNEQGKETGIKIPDDLSQELKDVVYGLEAGDLIRLSKGYKGIANIELIFDYSTKKLMKTTVPYSSNSDARFVSGVFYEMADGYTRIIKDINGAMDETNIETHIKYEFAQNMALIKVTKNGKVVVTKMTKNDTLPGYSQGVSDIYVLLQTAFGRPVSMLYIDYSE